MRNATVQQEEPVPHGDQPGGVRRLRIAEQANLDRKVIAFVIEGIERGVGFANAVHEISVLTDM